MDPATTAILKFIATNAAKLIFDSVKKKFFSKAADDMKQFIDSQAKFQMDLKTLILEQGVQKAAHDLLFWSEEFERHLRTAENGNHQPLERFLDDMEDASTGIGNVLDQLYRGITGENGMGGNGGLLAAWHEPAYKDLIDVSKLDFTVKDYLAAIESKLCCCFGLIQNGILIQTAIIKDEQAATDLAKGWEKKLKGVQELAYGKFPYAIKVMKSSYDAPWASSETRWVFEGIGEHQGKRLGCQNDEFTSMVQSNGPGTEWKLTPYITEGLIGLTNVGKSARIGVKHVPGRWIPGRMGSSVMTPSFNSESIGQGTPALYKLIPCNDPHNVGVVKLVGPIQEGGEKRVTEVINGVAKPMDLCYKLRGNGY